MLMESVKSEVKTYSNLKFQASRAIRSLTCVSCLKTDILFKTITLVNLAKKGTNALVSRKITGEPTPWIFRDVVVKVNFRGISYSFQCPRGYDFNVYLNPYYHEYDVVSFAFSVLQKGDVFIDVGAHGGLYTLLGGMIVGSRGQVIAVEPNCDNLKVLSQNVKLNELNNVLITPKAASDEKSKIKLSYEPKKTALTSAMTRVGKIIEVEAITLDEIAEKYDSIKLLKVDTEGYDLKVLKGACHTLRKTSYIVVEQSNDHVRKLLVGLGFRLYFLTSSHYLVAINKKSRDASIQKIFEGFPYSRFGESGLVKRMFFRR
jgi:FkbM family methyltransferase